MHYRNDIDCELASLAALQAAYLSVFREHVIHHLEKFLCMFDTHFTSAVEATANAAALSDERESPKRTVPTLLLHLHLFDDKLSACIFADVFGLLALKNVSLINQASDVCWTALHTEYTTQSREQLNDLPYTFLVSINALIYEERRNATCERMNACSRALMDSVVRSSVKTSKDYLDNVMTRNFLLLLWALMTHQSCSQGRAFTFLSKLMDELDRCLLTNVNGEYKTKYEGYVGARLSSYYKIERTEFVDSWTFA
jgi:hypothetical protein